MRAISINSFGGPEVLEIAEIEEPIPGDGEILVDVAVAGVNYLDIHRREGQPPGKLPFVPGVEGAGTVVALGAGVTGFAVGDRIAWKVGLRSYAERTVVSDKEAVLLPPEISEEIAAAAILQGLTAHYLANAAYPVRPGDWALVHAAAGGVGLMLTQMIKLRGGRVIGTVSSPDKERLAREAGADEVIRYDEVDFASEARRLTDGLGVNVVYDGVGADTFDGSVDSVGVRGMIVLFGGASGQARTFDLQRLGAPRSLFMTRPSLDQYSLTREELMMRATDLFSWITGGKVKVHIDHVYPLEEARHAHEALEGRKTAGKVLLRVR